MTDPKPIGQLIDTLGVRDAFRDDDLVTDVVVLSKVVAANGDVSISIASSDGCDWLTQLGIVSMASIVVQGGGATVERDE